MDLGMFRAFSESPFIHTKRNDGNMFFRPTEPLAALTHSAVNTGYPIFRFKCASACKWVNNFGFIY